VAVGSAGVEVADGVLAAEVELELLVAVTDDEEDVGAGVPLLVVNAIAVWVPAMISFISCDCVDTGFGSVAFVVGTLSGVPLAGRTQAEKIMDNNTINANGKMILFFMYISSCSSLRK
jgi:hypothetical protein